METNLSTTPLNTPTTYRSTGHDKVQRALRYAPCEHAAVLKYSMVFCGIEKHTFTGADAERISTTAASCDGNTSGDKTEAPKI